MNKKSKILLSAIMAIVCCASLIAGATMALFTRESEVNVAVTSGKVNVVASVEELKTYSGQWNNETTSYDSVETATAGVFTTTGKATVDGNTLTLERVVPMDKVTFKLHVENNSDVTIKYRTTVLAISDDGLFSGLVVTIDGTQFDGMTAVSNWTALAVGDAPADVEVSIELPENAGNEYQGKTCTLAYNVEAVQGNGNTVDLPADFIGIYNASDLRSFAKKVNSGVSFAGKTVQLVNDIDLNNEAWTPVTNFNATFDGNGKTIKNLSVTAENAGMFTWCVGAHFNNIIFDGATIISNGMTGVLLANGTCAHVDKCTVKNSTLISTPHLLANGKYDDGAKVGGVVGYACADPTNASVTNCTVTNTTIKAYRDLGGVVGMANGPAEVTGNTVDETVKLSYVFAAPYEGNVGNQNMGDHVGRIATAATVDNNTGSATKNVETNVINSKEELVMFANAVNAGNTYEGKTVKLGADIDLAGIEWTPIGGKT
ncbi:MAG: hypothetical protein MJ072_00775, partial [Clostridia bacterium]|nr:hypothetical protein [Clostridia bacterium]